MKMIRMVFLLALLFSILPMWFGHVRAGENSSITNLPPDPGPAGMTTLAGIDSDNDGVRDDVQRWIAINYPNSQKTRAALTQKAKSMQQFLLNTTNSPTSNFVSLEKSDACLAYVQPNNYYQTIKKMKAIFLNTSLRITTWLQVDHQLSGGMFPSIPDRKQGCGFNPDTMPN